MENRTLGIRCRIVAQIPTGIHRFDGNSPKIRSDSYRIRVGPVVGLNLLGPHCQLLKITLCVLSLPDEFLRETEILGAQMSGAHLSGDSTAGDSTVGAQLSDLQFERSHIFDIVKIV